MQYRAYRSISWQVSQLGFGCMRLPCKAKGKVDRPKAIRMFRTAFEQGVNYYDTALVYHNGESEEALGEAVKPFRNRVVISTKNPTAGDDTQKKWTDRVEVSCKRLGFAPDIMNFHGLTWKCFIKQLKPKNGLLKAARRAQAQGLFKYLAFSCHDQPKNMIKLLNTGEFVGITLQYNILDRKNEAVLEHAYKKGLGVVVMGPVAGGRLAVPSGKLQRMVRGGAKSTPEIALRFVLANPHVTSAISGMSTLRQVQENLKVGALPSLLSDREKQQVKTALKQIHKLTKLYCTGCGYCMPCPNKVNIPRNFDLMNTYRVWDLKKLAQDGYAKLTDADKGGLQAKFCEECGACLPKCPQKIQIIKQLKETHIALSK